MSTLLGADLNGVLDHRVGRELNGPDESADIGIRGSLVRLEADGIWVAGQQAALAPHGRGDAWGALGAKTNRIFLTELYDELSRREPDESLTDAVAAALPGILMDCELATFAIPDTPSSDDLYRDRYLRLLRRVRGVRRPMLLWRSIATYLGWVQAAPAIHREGQGVGVLSLMLDGLHFSQLDTEGHGQGQDRRFVPVRRRFGQIAAGPFRGQSYVDELLSRLAETSGLTEPELQMVQMPWRIATGHRPEPEILKKSPGGRWIRLPDISPTPTVPTCADVPPQFRKEFGKLDILLIEGPFAGQAAWLDGIKEAVAPFIRSTCQVVQLDRGCVARGCLEAGNRLKKGQPIYFDFLPQLQINGLVEGKPKFVDLIASETRCAGGRLFKANAKDRYGIVVGATRLRFWLFKQDFERGRKIESELGTVPDKQYPLSISVEQSPGQGLARVQISSPEYEELRRNPIVLDWMQMEEVGESKTQILQELEDDADLSYPDVAITKGHPILWLPYHPNGSLIELLRRFTEEPLIRGNKVVQSAWATLHALRLRFGKAEPLSFLARRLKLEIDGNGAVHPLNSDGSLPKEMSGLIVPPEASTALEEALEKLESDIDDLRRSFGSEVDEKLMRDVVGFASWCFHRCPDNLIEMMLETYEETDIYPIQHILLREGVGRVVSEPGALHRYFRAVARRLQLNGTLTAHEYSALGRVLGGVEAAAEAMDTASARRFMQEAIRELIDANTAGIATAYKTKFKATLRLAAALLRHRKRKWDFVDPQGASGNALFAALVEGEKRNKKYAAQHEEIALRNTGRVRAQRLAKARRLMENADVLGKIAPFVEMRGKHRDLINVIEAMTDREDDEDDADAGPTADE